MALNIVERIDDAVRVRNVLLSVSDKTGLDTFVPQLVSVIPDVCLYSTGGTHTAIATLLGPELAARHLRSVSAYTGQPEMQGGLVKTLDFKIYLGLLSETYNAAHQDDLRRVGGVAFDMVVCNLYPFEKTVAQHAVTVEQARTHIDIGGPCMVRASAKNFLRVAAVTDPSDYVGLMEELRAAAGCLSLETRWQLACKAFAHTAHYDSTIAAHFACTTFLTMRDCYRVES